MNAGPIRPRRHTLILPARNNVMRGEAGGGLRRAAARPAQLVLLAAAPTAAIAYAAGEPLAGLAGAGLLSALILGSSAGRRRRLHTGLQGERLAAQALRHLPDAVIHHDVMLGTENADHIVLTRQGIYTVEVKHWAGVTVDRRGVTVTRAGQTEPRDAVLTQAKRQSGKLARLLRRPVHPVIVFTQPGSQVRTRELSGVTICTLPTLCASITRLRRRSDSCLTPQAFAHADAALKEYHS